MSLNVDNKNNSLGISTIHIVLEKDILISPTHNVFSDFLIGNFILKNGVSWYPVFFENGTGQFSENSNTDSKADDFYTNQLTFKSAKAIPTSRTKINSFKNQKICAVYLDRNNLFKVIRKANCKVIETSGRIGGGFNGYAFTLNSKSIKKAGYLSEFQNVSSNTQNQNTSPNTEIQKPLPLKKIEFYSNDGFVNNFHIDSEELFMVYRGGIALDKDRYDFQNQTVRLQFDLFDDEYVIILFY